ncbi:uncharacterized protein LOC134528332 [Bacillus rossius redtenbacheri]|uniref:uncharacterized protein LOC134528332 n=1 Tax=Bacillus rossius redtenbacheri TaxID=93214 RepID=UPI002FDD35E4
MGGTRFMVQWEEHPSHLATRLGQLLEHQTLVDVTLMCNTHTLRVHRAVLAACSPYFETILQRQLGLHPLIVLKDMQFSVLKSLIEFMYCGETSVTEDNLGALLQAAKFFQVKGLSAMTREALGLPSSPQKTSTATTAVNGEAARKAFMGRSKRVGIQQTLVPASGLKTNVTMAGDGAKTTFQVASKTVPMSPQQQTHQQAESAQLLLSLSGGDFNKQNSSQTLQTVSKNVRFHQPRTVSAVDARKEPGRVPDVIERVPVMTAGAGVAKPAVDKQEVKTVYMPEAPRRRGRPLKRSMNLVFKEKVISETELALQKEAEASRKALEALQEEMKSDNQQQQFQQQQFQQQQQQAVANKTLGMVTAQQSKMHHEPVTKPQSVEAVTKQEPLYQVSDASGENVIYQLADGSGGASGNIMYKVGDQLITAQGAGNDGNIVYQLAEGIKSGDIVYQVADNSNETQEENNGNTNIIYQVAEGENVASENTVSNQCMEVLKEAGLPTNVPILLDSGNGQYITVNEEVLMNIVNGGMVQVADGNIVGGEGLQFIVQELPEEPGAPPEETHIGNEQVAMPDVLKQSQISQVQGPVTSQASSEALVQHPFEPVPDSLHRQDQDSLDTPVIENTLNTLAELTLTMGNPPVETSLHKPVVDHGNTLVHNMPENSNAESNDVTAIDAENIHSDNNIITGVIDEPGINISCTNTGEKNEAVPENEIMGRNLVVSHNNNENINVCGVDEADEVITGDRYGEEARPGFSVLGDAASPSKDDFPSQFLAQDSSVSKYAVTTTACGDIAQNFIFQEESSSSEAPQKVAATEHGESAETMSVEQELEAMMGENSDTDDASKVKEEVDGGEAVQQNEVVAAAQPGSTTDEETQDLRMVLSPEEARCVQSADDSLDESILMVLSPDASGIKLSTGKPSGNGCFVGAENVQSTLGMESILSSDTNTTQVRAGEDGAPGEFVILEGGVIANVEGGTRVVYQGTAEYGEAENSRPAESRPEGSVEYGVVDDAVVPGDGAVEPVGGDASKTSPPKDIPYAVGLLPLKTALEKLQAMPEHQPRKTRSGSKDSPPECRAKRKASASGDPEKRQRVSEDDEDLELEEMREVDAVAASSSGVVPLPSMVDLTADANDG